MFRCDGEELWASDYDTLLKVGTSAWEIIDKIRLQGPSQTKTMQFIGGFNLSSDEKHCIVARPFSNDVVLMDCKGFKKIKEVKCKGEPINSVITKDLRYIVQDWKTGHIGYGSI